jgi:hypothetical protein
MDLLIVRANDRAEELIHRKLPKERSSLPQIPYWSLVEVAVRLKNDNWPNPPIARGKGKRPDPKNYVLTTKKEIAKLRLAGKASRYWIRLKPRDSKGAQAAPIWLLDFGGPLIREDKTVAGQPLTYGTIEATDPLLSDQLEDRYEALKSKGSSTGVSTEADK